MQAGGNLALHLEVEPDICNFSLLQIASRIPEDRLAASSILSVPKHFEMFCHVVLNLGKQNSKRFGLIVKANV